MSKMFVRYDDRVIDELHRKLSYDPISGHFTWKEGEARNNLAGKRAGTVKKGKNKNGYREIHIAERIISEHKLAWYFVYGEWPDQEIDHINHDRSDNRISNLRLVDRSTQNRSACRRKDNTSGITGVYWCKRTGKWLAAINYEKKNYTLGRFDNIEDAAKARQEAQEKFKFSPTHGKELSKYAV